MLRQSGALPQQKAVFWLSMVHQGLCPTAANGKIPDISSWQFTIRLCADKLRPYIGADLHSGELSENHQLYLLVAPTDAGAVTSRR